MSAAPSPSYRTSESDPKGLPSAPGTCRRLTTTAPAWTGQFYTYGPDGPEITEENLPPSTRTVFDRAGDRSHTTKAVLVATPED
jgi:ornithine carbamoyltransferase